MYLQRTCESAVQASCNTGISKRLCDYEEEHLNPGALKEENGLSAKNASDYGEEHLNPVALKEESGLVNAVSFKNRYRDIRNSRPVSFVVMIFQCHHGDT